MENNEFFLCNGRSMSDSPAKFTYIGGNGTSVIDLVLGSLSASPFLRDFKVLKWGTRSDYLSVEVHLNVPAHGLVSVDHRTEVVKLKFGSSKVENFTEHMRWKNEVGVDAVGDTDAMNDLLVSAITAVATELDMRKIVKHREINTPMSKPWFDDECRNVRALLKGALVFLIGTHLLRHNPLIEGYFR